MASRTFSTFLLSGQLFGIDILVIREINRLLEITPVPHASDYICGLLNLRGQIVTILDLNRRLGLDQIAVSDKSHNIILKTEQELQNLGLNRDYNNLATSTDKVGLLVDDIKEVVIVSEDSIEPPPANIGKIDGQFLTGVLKQNNALIAILSVEKLLK